MPGKFGVKSTAFARDEAVKEALFRIEQATFDDCGGLSYRQKTAITAAIERVFDKGVEHALDRLEAAK